MECDVIISSILSGRYPRPAPSHSLIHDINKGVIAGDEVAWVGTVQAYQQFVRVYAILVELICKGLAHELVLFTVDLAGDDILLVASGKH